MSCITARPEKVEVKSHWLYLLLYLSGLITAGLLCWLVIIGQIEGLRFGDFAYWISWLGILLCAFGSLVLVWNLVNAGEVMISVSSEGVWIKGGKNGTTIPWELVDDVVRPTGKQKQFLVLKMTDENYGKLNRAAIHAALFQINKSLGVHGIALNISGSTVSHEQFESWVVGYWNDWKERQAKMNINGKEVK
jgi:hypothetical protein